MFLSTFSTEFIDSRLCLTMFKKKSLPVGIKNVLNKMMVGQEGNCLKYKTLNEVNELHLVSGRVHIIYKFLICFFPVLLCF